MKRFKKFLIWVFVIIVVLVLAFLVYFKLAVEFNPPHITDKSVLNKQRIQIDTNFYVCGNNWLRKSKTGLWEMYLEGKPFERGVIAGKLSKELITVQEKAFVSQFDKMVPSRTYLKFLKYFIAWFNRNLDKSTDDEYLQEIYGISLSASDSFKYIGPAYQRMLNYHSAHDIGHALQNYHMVGCTSFACWGNATEDSSLIIGRNFDFFVGVEFAQNKIICFVNPEKGYKFMYVTWAGMTGVVSGMNEKGLTVTINSSKSEIPFSAATPVSIVAREILQYSSTIDQAFAIAKKRKTFVSESFMIGSAIDHKTAIIEKSPTKTGLFFSESTKIICTNHFQSKLFADDKLNKENIEKSSTKYRYNRVAELLNKYPKLNVRQTAVILRDQLGMQEKNIGMGNEKAVNQLIAHHSIIFKPEELKVWISSNPYQLGEYVAYDLKKIFSECKGMKNNHEVYEENLIIPADTFLLSVNYKNYKKYLILREQLKGFIHAKKEVYINEQILKDFIQSNPEYFLVYSLSGDCYKKENEFGMAITYYNKALTKEITSVEDRTHILNGLRTCYSKNHKL